VLQKLAEERKGPGSSPFLLDLGRYSKQAGNEGDLPGDVAFGHALHLPLADHMHALIPLKCSPCRFHRKEAHPRLDQPFDEAVILLNAEKQRALAKA
jgi:hypothetical protein